MTTDILPRNTNFIVTKIIDSYGTAQLSWPYYGIGEDKVPIGFRGFIFRDEKYHSIPVYGYLVKLEDGSTCFLPRESFELIDEKIMFLSIYIQSNGQAYIYDMKTTDCLQDPSGNTLLFDNKENAEKYILENFEIHKHG